MGLATTVEARTERTVAKAKVCIVEMIKDCRIEEFLSGKCFEMSE